MTDDLVLYTHPMSRGRMARWMMEEVGAPYRTEIVDYGPPMKTAGYLAVNPMGKVPALRHGAAIITETGAICAYLADAFPQAGLAPAIADAARGTYLRWMFFGAGPVDAAATAVALGYQIPPERRGMVGYGGVDLVADVLAQALTQAPYLAGDAFTAADVYVGSQIAWGMQFGTLPKRTAFDAYLGRILSRPAAIRAKEIDDALLAAHPMPGHTR